MICQMLFLSMPFKAEAIVAEVVVDVPAMVKMIKDFMLQVMTAVAKKAAMQMMASKVTSSIGGGSNGPMFISDWRDALQTQPEKATKVQMQNLFTTMGAGAGTASASGSAGYVSGMLSGASKTVLDSSIPEVINMAEYGVDDPSQVFNGKNMRAFLTAFGSTSKIGNRIEATLFAQDQKNKFDEINRRLASTQAAANGGYYSAMSNGKVITPGASIRDLMASAQNMSFTALATAPNIQEAVASVVARVITNTMKKGIGGAKESAQKNSGSGSSSSKDLKGSFGDLSVGNN